MKSIISVIIPTYNRKDQLEKCLCSLFNQNYPNDKYEIIVVDDGSTDETEEMITELIKNTPCTLKYLNQENKGASAARNLGIENSNSDYICFVDSDICLDTSCLEVLISAIQRNSAAGAMGPVVYFKNEPEKIWCAGARIKLTTARPLFGENVYRWKSNEDVSVDYLPSCVLLTSKEVIEKVGGFDEVYRIYYEDVDWCLRVKNNGYKILLVPDAKAWHDIKQDNANINVSEYYRNTKNRIRLVFKNATKIEKLIFILHFLIIENAGSIIKYSMQKRFDLIEVRFRILKELLHTSTIATKNSAFS